MTWVWRKIDEFGVAVCRIFLFRNSKGFYMKAGGPFALNLPWPFIVKKLEPCGLKLRKGASTAAGCVSLTFSYGNPVATFEDIR